MERESRNVWLFVPAEGTYVSGGAAVVYQVISTINHGSKSQISWLKKLTYFPSRHRLLTRELSRVCFYTF